MPPSILWIMADQLRRDCVGAYGSRGVRTPNLDSLAAEGITFDRFYATCPLCAPARSSLHTGRYVHSCGALVNGFSQLGDREAGSLNPDEVTVDEILASQGYHIGHVGVDHVRTDPPLRQKVPFTKFVSIPEYNAYCAERGLELPSKEPHQKAVPTRFGEEIREFQFSAPNPGRHPFAPEDYLDVYYARQAADFIADAPDDRPWALFCFLWLPHPPFVIPEPYFSMYGPHDVDPPPNLMAPQTGKPEVHLSHLPGQIGADPSREEWLETWAAYVGCVALLDDCIGMVLRALEEKGVAEDTLIVFHPDHGEMLGAHRYFQKMVCYEESIRLPLIVRPPRSADSAWRQGSRRGQLCSQIDIAPTLLDHAGLGIPERMQGRSLAPMIEASDAPGADAVFCEYNGNLVVDETLFQRAVTTERFKYIWNHGGFVELYDLEEDPYEMANRAGQPAYKPAEQELRAHLRQWMQGTDDIVSVDG